VRTKPANERFQLRIRADDAQRAQQGASGLGTDLLQVAGEHPGTPCKIGQRLASGDDAEPRRAPSQAAQERFDRRVAQLAALERVS